MSLSAYYRKYKLVFFLGLGGFIILNSLTLVSVHLLLGLFSFFLAIGGMCGLAYLDAKERKYWGNEWELPGKADREQAPSLHENCLAMALFRIDDYDEVFYRLGKKEHSLLTAAVDKFLRDWAHTQGAFLQKEEHDRYLLLLTEEKLASLEDEDFPVLEQIKKIGAGNKLPVTLSIGVGKGLAKDGVDVLGRLAWEALELALTRGGDQAIVKNSRYTWFYGGRMEVVGKRAEVQAHLAAAKLQKILQEAGEVVIMGHRNSDFDTLGASLGLLEMALAFGVKARLVVDHPGTSVEKLLSAAVSQYPGVLGEGRDIISQVSNEACLLLVDVNNPEMVAYPPLLEKAQVKIAIDHHIKGERFFTDLKLSYLEPSASSACELVAKLAGLFTQDFYFSSFAATALLAGIIMDTKRFNFSTGRRTFEVAAGLLEVGADLEFIRNLFQESLEELLYRLELLRNVKIMKEGVAFASHRLENPKAALAAAKAADTLLEVEGVKASFVIYPFRSGVAVSARSDGEINVQHLMEVLGGGGHLRMAAAYLEGVDLEAAESKLLALFEEKTP